MREMMKLIDESAKVQQDTGDTSFPSLQGAAGGQRDAGHRPDHDRHRAGGRRARACPPAASWGWSCPPPRWPAARRGRCTALATPTPRWTDAYLSFDRVKELTARLAEIDNSVYRLAVAIKKTQSRANTLENIDISRNLRRPSASSPTSWRSGSGRSSPASRSSRGPRERAENYGNAPGLAARARLFCPLAAAPAAGRRDRPAVSPRLERCRTYQNHPVRPLSRSADREEPSPVCDGRACLLRPRRLQVIGACGAQPPRSRTFSATSRCCAVLSCRAKPIFPRPTALRAGPFFFFAAPHGGGFFADTGIMSAPGPSPAGGLLRRFARFSGGLFHKS